MTHTRLYVCHLDEQRHRQTCGYWFTVSGDGGQAHIAFATRAGLDRWMLERGLALDGDLTAQPSHCAIVGSYRTNSHMLDSANFPQIVGERTRAMSNGQWVEAIISTDADGIKTVHTLNPNVRDRKTFDYRESQLMMS